MRPFLSWLPVFTQETIFLNFVCQKLIMVNFQYLHFIIRSLIICSHKLLWFFIYFVPFFAARRKESSFMTENHVQWYCPRVLLETSVWHLIGWWQPWHSRRATINKNRSCYRHCESCDFFKYSYRFYSLWTHIIWLDLHIQFYYLGLHDVLMFRSLERESPFATFNLVSVVPYFTNLFRLNIIMKDL